METRTSDFIRDMAPNGNDTSEFRGLPLFEDEKALAWTAMRI